MNAPDRSKNPPRILFTDKHRDSLRAYLEKHRQEFLELGPQLPLDRNVADRVQRGAFPLDWLKEVGALVVAGVNRTTGKPTGYLPNFTYASEPLEAGHFLTADLDAWLREATSVDLNERIKGADHPVIAAALKNDPDGGVKFFLEHERQTALAQKDWTRREAAVAHLDSIYLDTKIARAEYKETWLDDADLSATVRALGRSARTIMAALLYGPKKIPRPQLARWGLDGGALSAFEQMAQPALWTLAEWAEAQPARPETPRFRDAFVWAPEQRRALAGLLMIWRDDLEKSVAYSKRADGPLLRFITKAFTMLDLPVPTTYQIGRMRNEMPQPIRKAAQAAAAAPTETRRVRLVGTQIAELTIRAISDKSYVASCEVYGAFVEATGPNADDAAANWRNAALRIDPTS